MPNARDWWLTAAIIVALVATAKAQPANDDCADATVIALLPFTDAVDTTTATTEAGDLSCEGAEYPSVPVPEANSVWYTYTPSEDVLLTVDTADSDFGIVATIALGSCGALAIVDCDPSLGYNDERVTAPVNAGTTAFIEIVTAPFEAPGNAVVKVTETPIAAATPRHTGVDFQVNEVFNDYERFPDVAADPSGNFVVVWSGDDGSSYGVVGRRFDAGASPLTGDFAVNTYTTDTQSFATIAMDAAGGFVVAWQSYDQPASWDVIARRFDAAAAPLGGELAVNTFTTGRQYYPDVAADPDGNFVVVWQSAGQDGSGLGVFGRRFDDTGAPAGAEFQVNTYTTGDQSYPKVSVAADGSFVVVWESQAGVFVRRYDVSGTPAGAEFQVSVATLFGQYAPTVAMDGAGRFLVAWSDLGDVSGRVFDSDGSAVGGEIQVSRVDYFDPSYLTSAANAAGDFIVAWTEPDSYAPHPDVNGPRVIAQRLSSTGGKLGDEFQVNTYATWAQERPTIGMAATGQFVVVWEDYTEYPGRDGFGPGIFGHRFTLPPAATMIGVRPTKLIVVDKTAIGSGAKVVYVSKDQMAGITKGAGTDPAAVSARFDVAYDSTTGGFVAPAGATDGTTGWGANKPAVVKYANKAASLTPGDSIKVTVLKTGKLIKVVSKGLGDDATLDIVAAGTPVGPVASCYTIDNGGDVFRFGSTWAPGDCSFKEIAGGTGRKLVCKGGAADPTCAAAD